MELRWPAKDQVEFVNPWNDVEIYLAAADVRANINCTICHFRNDFFGRCVKGLDASLVFDWDAGKFEFWRRKKSSSFHMIDSLHRSGREHKTPC